MKKQLVFISLIFISLFILGCSQDQTNDSTDMSSDSSASEQDFESELVHEVEIANIDESVEESEENNLDLDELEGANRKIIYNAYLDLEVKHYLEVIDELEQTVSDMNGYIVTNQTSRLDDELHEGHLVLRIPQESLNSLFDFLEASEQVTIKHRNVTGEDVTEEYIDLETRLESREQLEARLTTFMEEAETTEDLLNISRDLTNVQYEIEQIKGQMDYLDNRSDLATVELSIIEQQTELAHDQSLNVGERIKEQWLNSYNSLLVGATNLFVIVVGNIPILVVVLVLGGCIFWVFRKRKIKKETSKE
ncbi:DUF4349 domain-containing protein [Amphibacillus sp. Q70]|uniref:DUF4349 domain-containing protein n=1 Tax=Amphibacillus sp. Q70 TaxID=3453416 RepID=UPI003F8597BF